MNKDFVLFHVSTIALLFLISCGPQKESRKLFRSGNYLQAIPLLQAEIAKDSTDVDAWVLLAQSYEKAHDADSAIFAFQRAWGLNPGNRTIQNGLTRLYISKANQLQKEGNFSKALQYWAKAEKVAGKSFVVYYGRGLTYLDAGYLEKAKIELQKAARLSPKDPRPEKRLKEISVKEAEARSLYQKGKVFYKQKRWGKAIDLLEKAVKIKADYKAAQYILHLARGRRLYKKGSVSALWDAIGEFGLAATLFPEFAEPQYLMALAYEKKDRNDFSMPIEVYRKVIEIEPNGPYAAKAQKRIHYLLRLKNKLDQFWRKKKK